MVYHSSRENVCARRCEFDSGKHSERIGESRIFAPTIQTEKAPSPALFTSIRFYFVAVKATLTSHAHCFRMMLKRLALMKLGVILWKRIIVASIIALIVIPCTWVILLSIENNRLKSKIELKPPNGTTLISVG